MKPEKKDTNPKDLIAATKLPIHLCPGTAKVEWTLALLEGALKYGRYNYRVAGCRGSVYIDALERHLEKYKNGEDRDPKTKVHHLGSIMASASILLDAAACDKLVDDRPPRGPAAELIDGAKATVVHLQQLYKVPSLHHNTIEDSQWAPESNPTSTIRSTTRRKKRRSKGQRGTKPGVRPRKRGRSKRATGKR